MNKPISKKRFRKLLYSIGLQRNDVTYILERYNSNKMTEYYFLNRLRTTLKCIHCDACLGYIKNIDLAYLGMVFRNTDETLAKEIEYLEAVRKYMKDDKNGIYIDWECGIPFYTLKHQVSAKYLRTKEN